MSQSLAQIDHVVITVGDKLDAALRQYEKLGFTLTPRGHHSLGTSNNLAIFTTTYLELLGYETQNADKIDSSWRFADGLTGLVFKTTDAELLFAELSARQIKLEGTAPKAFFRPVLLEDGRLLDARFKIVRLDPAYTPNGQIFFCDQLTPELVWRSEWQSQPNGVTNVARVIIESPDPADAITLLRTLFPAAKIEPIKGGLRLHADTKRIDYITPSAAKTQFGSAIAPANNSQDRKIGLELTVSSLTVTRRVLEQNGIHFTENESAIVVPASQTYGVVLIFSPA